MLIDQKGIYLIRIEEYALVCDFVLQSNDPLKLSKNQYLLISWSQAENQNATFF